MEEILSHVTGKPVQAERPIMDIPGGLVLPNGERIDFLIGEAVEVGATAVRPDVNAEAFHLLSQEMLRSLFDPAFPAHLQGKWAIDLGLGRLRRLSRLASDGIQRMDAENPYLLKDTDKPGEPQQKWWIINATPESLKNSR